MLEEVKAVLAVFEGLLRDLRQVEKAGVQLHVENTSAGRGVKLVVEVVGRHGSEG